MYIFCSFLSSFHLRLQPDLTLLFLQSKLAQPDSGHSACKDKHTGHNDRPVLNVSYVQAVCCPSCRADRGQPQRRDDVSADPVVFIDALRLIHSAIQAWSVVLCEPNDGLDVHQDVESETEDRVRRLEVLVSGASLVHLDDNQTSSQGGGAEDMKEEVYECAGALLFGCVGWLQDEGGLDGEEEAGGVEKLQSLVSDH